MSARPKLEVESLIDAARAQTGLDDFGAPGWREGLEVLVDSLTHEARLTEAGRANFAAQLTGYLANRLGVIDWRRRHAEIAEQAVGGPLVILGLPRTGTTALSNLLAQDPTTRSLRMWESRAPVPPPQAATYWTDPRIAASQAGLDAMNALVPEMRTMHDDDATSTAESMDFLAMTFRTEHFSGLADVRSYEDWWMGCDMEGAYRFQREALQLMQWRCPPMRWHLKNPPEIFFLDAARAVYPEAVFVWTHRDPARALSSICSFVALLRAMHSDRVDRAAMGARHVELWAEGIERAMAFRKEHGEGGFIDVHMRDLVADPLAAAGRIYEGAGWPFTAEAEAAIARWAKENRQGKHGRHEPDPADFGLDPASVHERFADYIERFGVLERRLTPT